MRNIINSPRYRKYSLYVLLVVLGLSILAHNQFILEGYFTLRRALWFVLGAVTFLFILARKPFVDIVNGTRTQPPTVNAKEIVLSGFLWFMLAIIWGRFSPAIYAADVRHFYTTDIVRFQQIATMRDEIMSRNTCDTCIFTYTRRGIGETCKNGGEITITEEEYDILSGTMFDHNIQRIFFSGRKIFFIFMYTDDLVLELNGDAKDPHILGG